MNRQLAAQAGTAEIQETWLHIRIVTTIAARLRKLAGLVDRCSAGRQYFSRRAFYPGSFWYLIRPVINDDLPRHHQRANQRFFPGGTF